MLNQAVPQVTPALVGLIFTEGFLAFVSPCILPMLPVYVMYLGGSSNGNKSAQKSKMLINTLGFIAGFTIIFVLLGAAASGLGSMAIAHRALLQRLGGIVMVVFGLHFCGLLKIPALNRSRTIHTRIDNLKFLSSLLFGAVFSLGWTPCLGPFLGSALLLASSTATVYEGMALLLVFSMGLGIPFILTSLLWGKMQGTLTFIKKHLSVIKIVSGGLLIAVGLLMVFDLFGYYMGLFS